MIQLKVKTEYDFLNTFGPIAKVIDACKGDAIGIADPNTWGHVPFYDACKKAGKKPILGVQLPVFESLEKVKVFGKWMTFLAKNKDGLSELYRLVTKANENFYYTPRILAEDVCRVSKNLIMLSGPWPDLDAIGYDNPNLYLELNPGFGSWNQKALSLGGLPLVVTSDVYYPMMSDRQSYEVLVGRNMNKKTTPQHILSESELRLAILGLPQSAFDNTYKIGEVCNISLPQAKIIKIKAQQGLKQLCRDGFIKRGIPSPVPEYLSRLKRELEVIQGKGFEDYFFLVADMVNYAKSHMVVGPARGSAAGSLVCWLLGITEVDPIRFGLLFERFTDPTRSDLPDIDLDFPDTKRDMVRVYLIDKYGADRVAQLGTISRYKPKSAITDIARTLNIPSYECEEVKKAIIERSGGDARANLCIMDTFESLDIGKALLAKYPAMKIASEIEGHARHSGVHAAGIVVCADAITNYCTIKDGVAQLDKYDAEKLGMLKIDVLGLRTLSVIEDCLNEVNMTWQELYAKDLEDEKVFALFNAQKFTGIFQFEGYALQTLCKQMGIHKFDDIVAITSLARPGPLHCGGANSFVARRIGIEKIEYTHPVIEPYLKETLGIVVYQEQVMQISKDIGQMSWEDVNALRKGMSKTLGDEFFNKYRTAFAHGAKANGLSDVEIDTIWKTFMTFGSWAFNKSHGVSYGLISYYCAWLKAHHPLEYAVACLRNEKDEDGSIKMLRELVHEGYEFVPFDRELSEINWSIKDGKLVGGLLSVKGIGPKTAEEIVNKRKLGLKFTPGQLKMMEGAKTPFSDIFECERRFGDYYKNPEKYGIISGEPVRIKDIQGDGDYIFIAKIREKNQRDMNEYQSVQKRGGKLMEKNILFLNLVMEDDTDSIICSVNRFRYEKLGKPIVEGAVVGDWYLVKGHIKGGWRKVDIEKLRRL